MQEQDKQMEETDKSYLKIAHHLLITSPATSNSMLFFYCLVSLTQWVIVPHLMRYFT